tara:strand:- start:250 stop:639 length:390 start_codon:yes stop_codon:yes gene_type:complete
MKIFHFQLSNSRGTNLATLVCNLNAGSIDYNYYDGHSSSGCPLALSNLQCVLPVFKEDDKETKEQFTDRVENIINRDSVRRVINRVNEVSFDEPNDRGLNWEYIERRCEEEGLAPGKLSEILKEEKSNG